MLTLYTCTNVYNTRSSKWIGRMFIRGLWHKPIFSAKKKKKKIMNKKDREKEMNVASFLLSLEDIKYLLNTQRRKKDNRWGSGWVYEWWWRRRSFRFKSENKLKVGVSIRTPTAAAPTTQMCTTSKTECTEAYTRSQQAHKHTKSNRRKQSKQASEMKSNETWMQSARLAMT